MKITIEAKEEGADQPRLRTQSAEGRDLRRTRARAYMIRAAA